MMKHCFGMAAPLILAVSLQANESFNSEASHFVGGGVMAGGISAVIDRYYPEHRSDRGMLGFGISSVAIVAFESVSIALNGKASGQILDMACHIAGSALGAYVTDRFILSPVIDRSATEGKYVGLTLNASF